MLLINNSTLIKEAKLLIKELKSKDLKLCSIESCTGGLFSYIITSIPGSSIVYDFGIVTYSNHSKIKLANVFDETIKKFGAVSNSTASEMSKNIIFVLWGNYAKSKKKYIDENKHYILEATHPSPLSANRGGFFGCSHFSKINNYLKEIKRKEIDWNK